MIYACSAKSFRIVHIFSLWNVRTLDDFKKSLDKYLAFLNEILFQEILPNRTMGYISINIFWSHLKALLYNSKGRKSQTLLYIKRNHFNRYLWTCRCQVFFFEVKVITFFIDMQRVICKTRITFNNILYRLRIGPH